MVALFAFMAQSASAFVPCPSEGNRAGIISEWETLWPPRETDPKGVTMCLGEEGIWGTDKAYLQMVDLGDGARIRLHADADPESPTPSLTQPDTIYRKRVAEEWYSWMRGMEAREANWGSNWSYQTPENGRLFSVTNATFFSDTDNEHNTTVPFPILHYGERNTLGVAWRRGHTVEGEREGDWTAPKKVLKIGDIFRWNSYEEQTQVVQVSSFPTNYEPWRLNSRGRRVENSAYYSELSTMRGYEALGPEKRSARDAAVGFTPEYRVGESNRRNYLGTWGDTVYLLTSDANYTNEEAAAIMQEIQPGMEVIQLDGGGSAQLYSPYGEMDSSIPVIDREVANVLAIYRAP